MDRVEVRVREADFETEAELKSEINESQRTRNEQKATVRVAVCNKQGPEKAKEPLPGNSSATLVERLEGHFVIPSVRIVLCNGSRYLLNECPHLNRFKRPRVLFFCRENRLCRDCHDTTS